MRRKPEIRYTDMAIYVDNHIREKDRDVEKIIDYLTMLAYMLSVKRRFFNSEDDYDNFSRYIAACVYMRMTSPKIDLPEDDPKKIDPIKSCLNYMKKILYGRKCIYSEFEFESTTFTIQQDEICKDYMLRGVNNINSDMFEYEINDYLKSIDKIVKKEVYNGVYGKDKALCYKLYVACMLTLLRSVTLSNKNKKALDNWKQAPLSTALISRRTNMTLYDSNLEKALKEESLSAPIAYNLDEEYFEYVAFISRKIQLKVIKGLNEIGKGYELSEDNMVDILLSSFKNNSDRGEE